MTRRPDSGQEAVWDFRGLDLQTVVQKKDLGLHGDGSVSCGSMDSVPCGVGHSCRRREWDIPEFGGREGKPQLPGLQVP